MRQFKNEFKYKRLDVIVEQVMNSDGHCPDDYSFYISVDGEDMHSDGDFLNPDAAIQAAKDWIDHPDNGDYIYYMIEGYKEEFIMPTEDVNTLDFIPGTVAKPKTYNPENL